MSRRSLCCLALSLNLALPGCYSMTFVVAHIPEAVEVKEPVEVRNSFFLLGLAPTNDLDARAVCPHGTWQIEERTTFVDLLLTLGTLLIYTPRTSSYYCREPAPPAVASPESPSP